MTHAEKHASNSSGMSGDGSQRGASRYLRPTALRLRSEFADGHTSSTASTAASQLMA